LVPKNRVLQKLPRIFEAEFVFNAGAVGFNRWHAEFESLSDLAGALASADKFKNSQLTVAEPVKKLSWVRGTGAGHFYRDFTGNFAAEIDISTEHGSNGNEDILRGLLFGDVAQGPSAKNTLGVE
jgi:hypothetical protein